MGKIRQLDDSLSNKIAAGEVVERPASVVKELVENAIDANSSRIEIEIEEAGLSKIRIIDNGDGIEPDDCMLAFDRHATSKIKDEYDLFHIRTLGFRGEALPSIASIAQVDLISSTGKQAGRHIQIKGGEILVNKSSSSRKGTEITVKDLFYNTPARLKHLKTVHTELGNITDLVNRLALSHPDVSFHLSHNGKKLLQTNGNNDVLQVLAAIYGIQTAKSFIKIQGESIDFKISGYIAKPEVNRASRNYISIFVNGRYIKNFLLSKAIINGYHTLLPIGRSPIVLLYIEMDPHLLDVNVHPAKTEVRISKEEELMLQIEDTIKLAFRKEVLIPEPERKPKKITPFSEQEAFQFDHQLSYSNSQNIMETVHEVKEFDAIQDKKFDKWEAENIIVGEARKEEEVEQRDIELIQEEIVKEEEQTDRIPPLYPIGQLHGTYILAQNEKGLYLIDQHAAQERVRYEYYRKKIGEYSKDVQDLLLPITFELSQAEISILEQYLDELSKVGVIIEPFGQKGYIVRSHPVWLPKGREVEVIEEMIEMVLEKKKISLEDLFDEAATLMACKSSIKANHHLRDDETFAVLEALRKARDPFTCPHGRPIIIHFSTYEIEKMFKRVM